MQPPLVTEKGIFFADFGRDSRLYRLDLNGKNKTKLSDEYVKNMASDDGWIYYSGILGLHKIREDGTGNGGPEAIAKSLQVPTMIFFIESEIIILLVSKTTAPFERRTDLRRPEAG